MKTSFVKALLLIIFALAFAAAKAYAAPGGDPCKAVTKAGLRCKGRPKAGTEFCFVHDPSANRCGAMTAKKTPCKMMVKAGQKCRFHAN